MESLAPESEARLRELVDRLLETNRQFNLTAVRDPGEAWQKHILDSLQGLQTGLFDGQVRVVDVGSGAGFPGLPLAITRPDARFTFIEATRKKCGFIQATSEHFGLKAQVINARAEEAGHEAKLRAQFEVATVRAVGSFMEVAEYCLPLVKVGGHVVLWRGKDAEAEAGDSELALDLLGGALQDVHPYELPGHPMQYHLVILYKHGQTPAKYPRRTGIPKSQPLTG